MLCTGLDYVMPSADTLHWDTFGLRANCDPYCAYRWWETGWRGEREAYYDENWAKNRTSGGCHGETRGQTL